MVNKTIIIYKKQFSYELVRGERKTVAMKVFPDKKIVVKAPVDVGGGRIEAFIRQKYFWLKNQLADIDKYQHNQISKEIVSGERLLYLGRAYQLKVHEFQVVEKVCVEKNIINLYSHKSCKSLKHNSLVLEKWYKEQTIKVFEAEFYKMLKLFGYENPPRMIIKKMEKRWGSYTGKGTIILNPELIKASKNCIDYVIAHELCHVRYKNHNEDFYILLSIKFPNWQKTKEKLELRFAE